ncbi:MAG TPA: hypothetical protein VFG84_11695 [Gemmatimonadaceae bacterium]|nr:hypothetical protein [Gemmatimonadaceae bacterium]
MQGLWPALQLLAIFGLAFAIIKWVGGLVRDVTTGASASAAPLAPTEGLLDDVLASMSATNALQKRGIATDAQLLAMSPKERAMLLGVVASRLPEAAPVATPLRAVGLDVFCPACGSALQRQELKRMGHVDCPGCTRRIRARITLGQMTVTVDETAAEAERRNRLVTQAG